MTEMKILDMPVKAKWYDMQECGEKPEEYRGNNTILVQKIPWI